MANEGSFQIGRVGPIAMTNSAGGPDVEVEPVHSFPQSWLERRLQRAKDEVADYSREKLAEMTARAQQREVSAAVDDVQRLEDRVRDCLNITEPASPVQVDLSVIDGALSDPDEVVAQKFGLKITRRDIQTLVGGNWLNDQVINFYMNLIIERGKAPKWPKAYTLNTFFYPKLLKDGASSLKRWTKRVDIFSYDLIAVPIHLDVHWCMAIIDFRSNGIRYYDSMMGPNRGCLAALLNYLAVEHLDRKKSEFDTSDWSLENVRDIPQQINRSDCGMFSCAFAECLTRTSALDFSHEDVPYLRRKMVLEIMSGELLYQ